MASANQILVLLFAFLLCISASLAQTSFRPRALVLPVTKDLATGQYITQIKQRTPLVPVKQTVDLGGRFLWVDCSQGYSNASSSYRPVRCGSAQCWLAKSTACVANRCELVPGNPIGVVTTSGELGEDVVSLQSTDGSNPGRSVSVTRFLFTCSITPIVLEGLANGVTGMAGLGKGSIGLASQFSSAFSFKRKFAICLSSSTGVIFFGDGPYNFLPSNDLSKGLIYTPLLTNPFTTTLSDLGNPSGEYFIGVKAIKVNNIDVSVNATLLKINSEGYGGTKISTVDRYTMLETSIYNAVTDAFVKAIAKVPRVKAVAPFSVCYDSRSFSSTRLGPGVPTVEFVLQSGSVSWRIFGANSMVDVGNNVLCLGFLDAGVLGSLDSGVHLRTPIVIGAHQIENNLLQFDLAASRLGFSSLLFGQQTTCANFNFTSVA